MSYVLNHDPARGPYLGDDEPTVVRHLPRLSEVMAEAPAEPWRALLEDATVPIAAVTAALAFALSVGSGTVGFMLGILIG